LSTVIGASKITISYCLNRGLQRLRISNVEVEDSGEITCEGYNAYGHQSTTGYLVVRPVDGKFRLRCNYVLNKQITFCIGALCVGYVILSLSKVYIAFSLLISICTH